MSKTAIVYASVHHGNTKKIVDAIAQECEGVELIDAAKVTDKDMLSYDAIGFASGIYYGKFHQSVLNFAGVNLPQGKKVFFICTYGGKENYASIEETVAQKRAVVIGRFGAKGYDTYGPFKIVGGLCKGHPDEQEIKAAVDFYKGLDL